MKKIFYVFCILTANLAILDNPLYARDSESYQLVYFDGHIHTTHSDGSGSLADVKSAAVARGLSAVIVTNHTKQIVDINEWNDIVNGCDALSDPNFLMIPSFEVTGSEGLFNRDHFLAWGAYDPFVGNDADALAPEEVWLSPTNPAGTGPMDTNSIISWVNYIHTHGGLAVHAHTTGTTQPEYGADFIELYNVSHVKDIAGYAKMMGFNSAEALNLGTVLNNFADYGNRDLYMNVTLPGMPEMPLRTALHVATQMLTGQGEWLDAPEAASLHSWDDLLMDYMQGQANAPTFGVAESDAHNTANVPLNDPNYDDSDVGEAKNGLYVKSLTYSDFFEALRAGRSFATTGPSLCVTVNDAMMGQTALIDIDSNEPAQIHLAMNSNNPSAIIAKADIYKNGRLWQSLTPYLPVYDVNIIDEDVNSPDYYRAEIVSLDTVSGQYQFAWANPVFVNKVPTRTISYDWEDGGTILGSYLDIEPNNVCSPEPVYEGKSSLKLVDKTASGTPQAYLAWITGLEDGDKITAGFWQYDVTPDAAPSCRIWGHYTSDVDNIDSFIGSAGGNDSYGTGTGWEYLENTWIFDSAGGTRTGFVVEVRTYSNPDDTVWIDNLKVTAPTHAEIIVPGN